MTEEEKRKEKDERTASEILQNAVDSATKILTPTPAKDRKQTDKSYGIRG